MNARTSRPEQLQIALTRVCLRSGTVLIPPRLRDLLPPEGRLDGWDPDADVAYEIAWHDGRLHDLGPFFEARGLHVNDQLIVRPQPEGHLVLASHVRAGASGARREAAPVRYASGPARSRSDAGPPAQRSAASETKRSATPSEHGSAAERSEPATVRDGASPDVLQRARRAFDELGFEVVAGRGGTLRLDGGHGRKRVRALVRVLDEGTAPDWNALLQAVRDGPAERLALVGPADDLIRLERPARGARATLWSWDGLTRLRRLANQVPIGPLDLSEAFEEDGMHGPGIERLEARVAERVAAQEAFTAVVGRLAALHAPTVVRVEDLALDDDLTRDQAIAELERTSQPPLQWTRRVAPGEYALLHDVASGLTRLRAYAERLHASLPDPVRPRVHGRDLAAADGHEARRSPARTVTATEAASESDASVGPADTPDTSDTTTVGS